MWCEKCHYGSDNVKWKLDSDGKFLCRQCGTFGVALDKNPFLKGKSIHGKKEKPASKKFKFDQKDGKDSDNPAADRPIENPAVDKVAKNISKNVEKPAELTVDKPVELPEKAVEQPTELPKEQLETIDEAKLTPFVAQSKPIEQEGQNQAIQVDEKK